MIGNDVVDLSLARKESDWARRGFLDKIFNSSEQQNIFASKDSFEKVWLLWSMKESAYKIYNRATGIEVYNPKHFTCELIQDESISLGKVTCSEFTCFTKSRVTKHQIHTVAADSFDNVERIYIVSGIEVIKIGRLPFFITENKITPVSVSHHGRYKKVVFIK